MKSVSLFAVAIGSFLGLSASAQQVSFRTEFIGNSGYWYLPNGDKPKEKIGDSKGSSIIYQAAASLPISTKVNENNRPTAWGVGVSGAYVKLQNENFADNMVSEIMNLQLGIYHLRPLNDKWSLRAGVGMGVFTPSAKFSRIRLNNALGSGSVVFIRHLRPNLAIGGGLAVNSSLGYPMAFPAVYLNWKHHGKFNVTAELVDGLDLSASYQLAPAFKLSWAFEMNGQMALLEKDGKDVIFSHQYIVTGLRPEVKLGKTGFSMFGMVGLNLYRPASYSDRTLKGVFASNTDYYFSASGYGSVGLKWNLK